MHNTTAGGGGLNQRVEDLNGIMGRFISIPALVLFLQYVLDLNFTNKRNKWAVLVLYPFWPN